MNLIAFEHHHLTPLLLCAFSLVVLCSFAVLRCYYNARHATVHKFFLIAVQTIIPYALVFFRFFFLYFYSALHFVCMNNNNRNKNIALGKRDALLFGGHYTDPYTHDEVAHTQSSLPATLQVFFTCVLLPFSFTWTIIVIVM